MSVYKSHIILYSINVHIIKGQKYMIFDHIKLNYNYTYN